VGLRSREESTATRQKRVELVKVMAGFRVLELAQLRLSRRRSHLADWGADVLKVEHPLRGIRNAGYQHGRHPARSGAASADGAPQPGQAQRRDRHLHAGRQEVIYELAKTADVFLTNYMPRCDKRTNSTSNTSAR